MAGPEEVPAPRAGPWETRRALGAAEFQDPLWFAESTSHKEAQTDWLSYAFWQINTAQLFQFCGWPCASDAETVCPPIKRQGASEKELAA